MYPNSSQTTCSLIRKWNPPSMNVINAIAVKRIACLYGHGGVGVPRVKILVYKVGLMKCAIISVKYKLLAFKMRIIHRREKILAFENMISRFGGKK